MTNVLHGINLCIFIAFGNGKIISRPIWSIKLEPWNISRIDPTPCSGSKNLSGGRGR